MTYNSYFLKSRPRLCRDLESEFLYINKMAIQAGVLSEAYFYNPFDTWNRSMYNIFRKATVVNDYSNI